MFDQVDITPITLVDRACTGGFEFQFDGRTYAFKPGQIELAVPRVIAEWIFRLEKDKVWTKKGEFVHRLAAKDAPEDFVALVGEDCAEKEPIEIDTARAEGWDAESMHPKRRLISLDPADVPEAKRATREHQGVAAGSGFGGRK